MTDQLDIEERLQAIALTLRQAQHNAEEYKRATTKSDPAYAAALGQATAYNAAATVIEELLTELPDIPTSQQRYLEAEVRADHYEQQLMELRRLLPQNDPSTWAQTFAILQP